MGVGRGGGLVLYECGNAVHSPMKRQAQHKQPRAGILGWCSGRREGEQCGERRAEQRDWCKNADAPDPLVERGLEMEESADCVL